jgi:hypothetical protein
MKKRKEKKKEAIIWSTSRELSVIEAKRLSKKTNYVRSQMDRRE